MSMCSSIFIHKIFIRIVNKSINDADIQHQTPWKYYNININIISTHEVKHK